MNVENLFTGYDYQIHSNGNFTLQRSVSANLTNGGNTIIFGGNTSPFGQLAPGDNLTVSAVGTSISYLRNGIVEASFNDPAPLGGLTCGFGLRNGSPASPTLEFYINSVTVDPILANTIYQFPTQNNEIALQVSEVSGRVYAFDDGGSVTTIVNTGTVSAYDAEVAANDAKRQIRLLKRDYLLQARAELETLTQGA